MWVHEKVCARVTYDNNCSDISLVFYHVMMLCISHGKTLNVTEDHGTYAVISNDACYSVKTRKTQENYYRKTIQRVAHSLGAENNKKTGISSHHSSQQNFVTAYIGKVDFNETLQFFLGSVNNYKYSVRGRIVFVYSLNNLRKILLNRVVNLH